MSPGCSPNNEGWRQRIHDPSSALWMDFSGNLSVHFLEVSADSSIFCLYEQPQMIYTFLAFSPLISYHILSTLSLYSFQINSCTKYLSQALFPGGPGSVISIYLSSPPKCLFNGFCLIPPLSLKIMQVS